MNLKVGDTVKVIAGDDKGSSGKVLKVIRSKNRVIVEGVAMVKNCLLYTSDAADE